MPDEPCINVAGEWQIIQKNGFTVDVNINQEGNQLNGFCTHSNGSVRSNTATGFVDGESFDFTIAWNNNTRGHYTGQLEPGHFTTDDQGILKGDSVDELHPESTSSWESSRTFDRL